MKSKHTIFFAYFKSFNTEHDRKIIFSTEKSLLEFNDWIEQCRVDLEKNNDKAMLLVDFKVITDFK